MINEADILVNNEVRINKGLFAGKTALVRKVMAEGRRLEREIAHSSGKVALIDVTMVSEIRERQHGEPTKSLGPIQNSVVKETI